MEFGKTFRNKIVPTIAGLGLTATLTAGCAGTKANLDNIVPPTNHTKTYKDDNEVGAGCNAFKKDSCDATKDSDEMTEEEKRQFGLISSASSVDSFVNKKFAGTKKVKIPKNPKPYTIPDNNYSA